MVAFYLPGGLAVYTFSLLLGFGAAAGLAWVAWQGAFRSDQERPVRPLEGGLLACAGALIGGRIAYVAANGSYFQANPTEALQVHLGGMAWPGALAGGLLALGLYAWLARQPLGALADALLPLLATVVISAWLGCWLDGCAYGTETGAWWGLPARDEWGVIARRVPTQLLGALMTLELFWILDRRWKGAYRPGMLALMGLFGLSFELWLISFLRADPAPTWQGQRLDSWAALVFMALTGVPLLIYFFRSQWRR